MKPQLEKIRPADGASWAWLYRPLADEIPFQWHHHPEFELTLTLNSRGQRFIGDHIGDYDDGDLVLVGANLPHTWASRDKVDSDKPHLALVMQFLPAWTAPFEAFTELKPVGDLLARAAVGLKFSQRASAAARPMIEALFARPAPERILALLPVLALLAGDREAEPLSRIAATQEVAKKDRGRIDRVLDHIHQHYAEGIGIEGLADIAALSPSGLHRLFRRHTGETVTAYVMRLRIGEACALLSGTRRPIAHVAGDVGYDSLANFNRQFKALKGFTPREYRKRFEASRML